MRCVPSLCLVLSACSPAAPAESIALPEPQPPVTYELSPDAYTVLQAVWAPREVSAATREAIDSGDLGVTELDRFEDMGLGVELAAGIDWIDHFELAPDFEAGDPDERRSLLYLWQAADPQIIDEESPIRFEAWPEIYRPQGHLTAQVFEAHVRTAARLSQLGGRPFDLALVAGDLTDGSQRNELDWMLTALNGGTIDPDSGKDDDPVAGPGNDFNDPFLSEGLAVPWYAVLGNHETLYNGGFGQITAALEQAAAGSAIYDFPLFPNGFRDGATPDAAVVSEGTTPADEARVPLRRPAALAALHEAAGQPAGHGLSVEDVAAGRGYFSFQPLPGKPIRVVALDTVNSTPTTVGVGSLGWLDEAQHAWLEAQLDAADAARELVLVMSHHRAEDFTDSSPVTGAELVATLAAHPGVVLHITGHGHRNASRRVEPQQDGERGYWELMLASTVDFPMQSRVIEIVDERTGHLSIYVTNVDHNSPLDGLAHQARALGAAKRAFGGVAEDGDVAAFWQADVASQNLLLRVEIPQVLSDALGAHDWPARVESEDTLTALAVPRASD